MSPPTIHALGTTVSVDLGEAIDPDEFAQAWSRCLVDSSKPEPADADSDTVGPRTTMTALTQAITRAVIERRRGELLMLHAGAVCHPGTGDTVAYVAPGGTGKTTLSHLLGQRYGYLTDETVGVDPATRLIHPYEKPLSMRTPEGGHPKDERGPDELGLLRAHHQPRLTTLALLRRSSEHRELSITHMDLFDAITALVPETSSLTSLERPLQLLAGLEQDLGGFWLLEYSEAEQLLDWIARRLGGQ